MKNFLSRFGSHVTAVLSGFDRLVFRGSLIPLIRPLGMHTFLDRAGVRLLDFGKYVESTTERVKKAALAEVFETKRPHQYLTSGSVDKEALAKRLLEENPIDEGLVCAFSVVEPCRSFEYHRSQDKSERGLKLRNRKCLHIYKYLIDRTVGFMSVRLETWFPFNIQICMNGREWLAHRLTQKGADFDRYDNCITRVADPALAQRELDRQLERNWAHKLDSIARRANPIHREIFEPWPQDYFWSAYQSEWATDLIFRDPASLAAIYPSLVRHAMLHFKSPDVMNFVGRKCHGSYRGEVIGSFKDRPEGVRVKHWINGNSIKMYDKASIVLRAETTVAKPTGFKVFRPLTDDEGGKLAWRPLRKGIADLHRRAEVSQRANERYFDALSMVDDTKPLSNVLDEVSKSVTYNGKRVRALRIGDADDIDLLGAVSRGEYATNGFRNRDLRSQLCKKARTAAERRRHSAQIGRRIRLLRAHGLISKVPKSHCYRLTDKGMRLTATVFAMRDATLKKLIGTAA